MGDVLVRGMTLDGFVKITAGRTTEITRRAREIHHTTAVATAALGRVLYDNAPPAVFPRFCPVSRLFRAPAARTSHTTFSTLGYYIITFRAGEPKSRKEAAQPQLFYP